MTIKKHRPHNLVNALVLASLLAGMIICPSESFASNNPTGNLLASSASANMLPVDQLMSNEDFSVSMKYLNSLNDADLLKLMEKLKWSQITDLGTSSPDLKAFYRNDAKLKLLLKTLEEKGKTYTAKDNKNIPNYIEIIRMGYYHGFYDADLKSITTDESLQKCLPAMKAIMNNPNFKLGTEAQNDVVKTIGLFINNTTCDLDMINKATPIINHYISNFNEFIKDRSKSDAIFKLMDGVQYELTQSLRENRDPKLTKFYGSVNDFINLQVRFINDCNYNKDSEWLRSAAIYNLGQVGKLHTDRSIVLNTLSKLLNSSEYLDPTYLEAFSQISHTYDGKLADGSQLDQKKIKEDAINKYYGKTYTFDNGSIVIKAGNRVSQEKIKRLYWATKEVKSKFFSVIGSDQPIDQKRTDDVLNIVIYNDKEEYEINRVLNGIDTNNGGMYLEGIGTFYTWDRVVPQDSIFELEELFRHEFTHYLQGRYIVPGLWGSSDLYKNDRLTWFEEGGAEFFAGSTRLEDIQQRKTVYGRIRDYAEDRRYSVKQTVSSGYSSGFDFYNFSSAFVDYLYRNNIDQLFELNKTIMRNDVKGLDALITRLSTDTALNQAYQAHMKLLADKQPDMTVPFVSDDYITNHDVMPTKQILDTIADVFQLKDAEVSLNQSDFFTTINVASQCEMAVTGSEAEVWKAIKNQITSQLDTLTKKGWSGFKTYNVYFTNVTTQANGKTTYRLVLEGLVNNQADKKDFEGSKKVVFNSGSSTPATPVTKEQTPTTATGFVSEDLAENDSFETAESNGFLIPSQTIASSLLQDDTADYYMFENTAEGQVKINANITDAQGKMNFLVYSADNLDQYLDYAKVKDNKLYLSRSLPKGKYFLVLYRFDKSQTAYTLNIEGDRIKKPMIEKVDSEVASNTKQPIDFSSAAPIAVSSSKSGMLNQSVTAHYYEVQVKKDSKIDLKVTSKSKDDKLNYLIYEASNLDQFIGYAQVTENGLEGTMPTAPGKYYIVVYTYGTDPINYTLTTTLK